MARCSCSNLPSITADPNSSITLTGSGTPGDPLVIGNNPAFIDQIEYPASGTWNKGDYPGVKFIRVRVVGGGGGSAGATGGAATGVARGGGGGAGYAEGWFNVSALAASVPVTVGAGGTAGTTTTAGGNGGDSIFSSLLGGGGTGSGVGGVAVAGYVVSQGGQGGAASGQIAVPGQTGNYGVQFSSTQRMSGFGGSSGGAYGHGGRAVTDLTSGFVGTGAGGGASGSAAFNNAFTGAAGATGLVVVEMFR